MTIIIPSLLLSFLSLLANKYNISAAIYTSITSITLKFADENPPYTSNGNPRTIPILNIFVPIIFPSAISNSSFF